MPFRRVAQGIVAFMLLMGAVTVVGARQVAAATTFTVTKTADTADGTCDSDCSLREAAASATSGASEIDFAVNGTFPITLGDIALATEITVNGNGRTDTVIDGGNSTRVFATDTAPVTLQHLTIQNGETAPAGAALVSAGNGTVNIIDCLFTGNVLDASFISNGGAIATGGSVNVTDSTFSDNHALNGPGNTGIGGAIAGAVVTVTGSTFTGNSAGSGGGALVAGVATVTSSTFDGNTANGNIANPGDPAGGGAILGVGPINVDGGSVFTNNTATASPGGAIANFGTTPVDTITIDASTIGGAGGNGNTAGLDGGGVSTAGGAVTLRNGASVIDNTATANGGGVDSAGAFDATDATVSGNTSSANGGGLDTPAGVTLQNSHVNDNHVTGLSGGGMAAAGPVNIAASTVDGNDAVTAGGGIASSGLVTVDGSTVNGNHLTGGGGTGGGIASSGGVTLRNGAEVDDNVVPGSGGGIGTDGSVDASGSQVNGNQAAGGVGGGIQVSGQTLSLVDMEIRGNTAENLGGAFLSGTGSNTATITRTTIADNTASNVVGGLGIERATFDVSASTLSGNTAQGTFAGGLGILNGVDGTITNSTFEGNSTAGAGGGIGVNGVTGSMTISFVTMADNTSPTGAGLQVVSASVAVHGSIFSSNTGGNCDGAITDSGSNLTFGTAGTCTFDASSDVDGEDPGLGTLAVNAPGTTATMALGAGSPAVDRVSSGCPPPSTDQRGVTRPQGTACDIGAYELAVATPETTTTSSPTTTTTAVSPSAAAGAGEAGRNGGTLPRTGTGTMLIALGVLLLAMGIGGHLLYRREHGPDTS